MKNRALLVFLAMVLVVSLVGVVACAVEEEEAPPVEGVWQWPDKLIVMSTSTATPTYGVAIAWTTPLAEDTGMTVRVIAEGLRTLRMKWLKEGVAFCSTESAGGQSLIESSDEYATRDGGPWQMRQFYPVTKAENSYCVRGDSDIRTPRDIKPGVRVVNLTFMPGYNVDALLAWAEVDPDDIVWVPAGSLKAAISHIVEGKADISFSSHVSGPLLYEAEAAPHGLAFIDLNPEADPEGAARYWEVSPEGMLAPMTTGVPSSVGIYGMIGLAPYQRRAGDDELVYQVVKWLDENFDRYKDAHPWCKFMTGDGLLLIAETDFCPIHDGSIRYLKELGLWTAEHQARQEFNVDRLTKYVDAYQAAMDYADEQGIDVTPENEEWLELWYSYRDKLPPLTKFTGLD